MVNTKFQKWLCSAVLAASVLAPTLALASGGSLTERGLPASTTGEDGTPDGAYDFTGSINDAAIVSSFTLPSEFTIQEWFNIPSCGVSHALLDTSSDNPLVYIDDVGGYTVNFGGMTYPISGCPSTGAWHLLTFTYSTITGVLDVYVDASNILHQTGISVSPGTVDILFGGFSSTGVFSLGGFLDEARILNVFRSSGSVTSDLGTFPFVHDGNTLALYHMDGAAGSADKKAEDTGAGGGTGGGGGGSGLNLDSSGSLLFVESYCEDYTMPTWSGSAVVTPSLCDQWAYTLKVPFIKSIQTQFAYVPFSLAVLFVRWFLIFAAIYYMARWLWRVITHYAVPRIPFFKGR